MPRTFGFALFAALAATAGAAVLQGSGSSLLAAFGRTLNDAQTLNAAYTMQIVGSPTKQDFTVALKKPNLARIETPSQIVVLDGKQVTTYTKGDNTYFRRPQAEKDLVEILANGDYWILQGFLDANAYVVPGARAQARRQENGVSVNVVQATSGHATATYHLNASDNVARTVATDFVVPGGTTTTVVLHVNSISLNAALPDGTFTFVAPDGARELSLDEINAGKWFTHLDEACKAAAATHKKVFIDFMATWCGPCHMLDDQCFHTDTFKKFAKNYVFCRIDVDQQPALAQQYGAEAIPLQVIADTSGNPLDKKVGYGGPDDFFAFLRKNAG